MKSETRLKLDRFQLRPYQKPIWDAIVNKNYKKVIAILPRRCLSGNTHILLANGSFKLLKDIQYGDNILSWDGNKFVSDKVIDVWETTLKETYKITSYKQPDLISSFDHTFAYVNGSDDIYVKWKSLKTLPQRPLLLLYAGLSCGSVHDPQLAEFLGFMHSDGYISDYQQPKFTNTNKEILNRVEKLAQILFDMHVIWRKKGNGYDLGLSNGTKGGGSTRNKIKELFRNDGAAVGKAHRRLLTCIWDFNEESILHFFAALISGDGSLYYHKQGFSVSDRQIPPAAELSIHCGKNYHYAWDIYWLLRKVGIIPQVPVYEHNVNWKIRVGNHADIKKLLTFPVYGKQEKQKSLLKSLASRNKQKTIFNGCYRTCVKKELFGYESLYDLKTENNHNFVANGYLVHNSGKDITAWNLCIRQCIKKRCLVYYILPTYSQAKKCIWDAIAIDGTKFLDFIPPELVDTQHVQEMKIRFKNGSILQCIGGDSYNTSLVGTNPSACVFSEFALMDPNAYYFARPILAANDGWALIMSTPRGKNYLWELYKIASELKDEWFVYKLTTAQTRHISEEVLLQEKRAMSEELFMQEYFTSFDRGVEGSYYAKYLDRLRSNNQIGPVPWEPGLKVYTAWDLGVSDQTCIIFFNVLSGGQLIRIIDCYSNCNVGLDHYVKVLQEKPYVYGKHFAPHDIKVREWAGGAITRYDKARELGITFTLVPNIGLDDGIEAVWTTFNKLYIDETNCKSLLNALENYRREWNEEKQRYNDKPIHNWASHYADCLRYLCLALPKTRSYSSPEELERRYNEVVYGDSPLPAPFNTKQWY